MYYNNNRLYIFDFIYRITIYVMECANENSSPATIPALALIFVYVTMVWNVTDIGIPVMGSYIAGKLIKLD